MAYRPQPLVIGLAAIALFMLFERAFPGRWSDS
jgi:hypothetical protein